MAPSSYHHRVWVPVNSNTAVGNPSLAGYLSEPRKDRRDTNLNPQRVAALHALVGGAENLEAVARACYATAREHLNTVSDLVDASDEPHSRCVTKPNVSSRRLHDRRQQDWSATPKPWKRRSR